MVCDRLRRICAAKVISSTRPSTEAAATRSLHVRIRQLPMTSLTLHASFGLISVCHVGAQR
jgi:hypothetical protein